MAESKQSKLPYVDNYDVFINFRGSDTRENFVKRLYEGLDAEGIRVFLDNAELTYGKLLAEELPQAIANSKIYIPVLSKTYASSKWCLRELAEIVRNKQEFKEKEILPVLYEVAVDDVKLKSKTGSTEPNLFEEYLKSHKEKESDETLEGWTKALMSIPKYRCWAVPNNDSKEDEKICQDIIKWVSVMLKTKQKQMPEPFGLEDPVRKIMKLLDVGYPNLRVVGVYGLGGMGKTTLAKEVYNRLCDSFDRCSFLDDVRKSFKEDRGSRGYLELQKKLLKDISRQDIPHQERVDHHTSDTDQAISSIQLTLKDKRVFLVFDDVSNADQILRLIGERFDSFNRGSRIIITARDLKALQIKGGPDAKFLEMEEMNRADALKLFSWHAFGETGPPDEEYSLLSEDVLDLTKGLPLSLEVTGSLLYKASKKKWEKIIKQLKEIPQKEVQERLKIGYEDLSNEAKEVFLDIACFFTDEERAYEFYMWKDCKFFPQLMMKELASMCFVKVRQGRYWMHDHIKDLGRSIARQGGSDYLGPCTRLWNKKDAIDILTRRNTENNPIKAIRLLNVECADVDSEVWSLRSENFVNLGKLRFLQLNHKYPWFNNSNDLIKLKLEGAFKHVFPNLRWLSWHNVPEQFNATEINMRKLVILDLSYSDITESWGGWKEIKGLHSLEVLDLTHCTCLRRTPDLSQYTSLKRLILDSCMSLEEIDRSIAKLRALKYLHFGQCFSLRKLPEEVFSLVNLKEIIGDFNFNVTMVKIPESVGELTSLVMLALQGSKMVVLPDAIGRLINMRSLDLSCNTELKSLPDSIGGLVKLEHLLLKDCPNLVSLPDSLTTLVKLQSLVLRNCKLLQSLPDSVGEMVGLKEIDISYTGLKKLPRFIAKQKKLEVLNASCSKLRGVLAEVGELLCLRILSLDHTRIRGLPSLTQLSHLEELSLGFCNLLEQCLMLPTSLVKLSIPVVASLQNAPDLSRMTKLNDLHLAVVDGKSEVQQPKRFSISSMFGNLSMLKGLNLCIRGLTITSEFFNLPELEQLKLECSELEITSVVNPSRLRGVIMTVNKITMSLSLLRLDLLNNLTLSDCEKLAAVPGLGELESLSCLKIKNCHSLEGLEDISKLRQLTLLDISDCKKLRIITGLPNLESLVLLNIIRCDSLESIVSSENVEEGSKSSQQSTSRSKPNSLERARIDSCPMLKQFSCVEGLKCLLKLEIQHCTSLEGLWNASEWSSLTWLEIYNCPKLKLVPGTQVEGKHLVHDLPIWETNYKGQLSSSEEEGEEYIIGTDSGEEMNEWPAVDSTALSDSESTSPSPSSFNWNLLTAAQMRIKGISKDKTSSSTSPKKDPSFFTEEMAIYEQLQSFIVYDEDTPPEPSPLVTNAMEAKAFLKHFLSGGIKILKQESLSDLTFVLDAAKALSLGDRSDGIWDKFSSKIKLASSCFKLSIERIQEAKAVHQKYAELKESAKETATLFNVLKDKADDDNAAKRQLVVAEMERQVRVLRATQDEMRIKDTERAISEGWLMSLEADWNVWRAQLD